MPPHVCPIAGGDEALRVPVAMKTGTKKTRHGGKRKKRVGAEKSVAVMNRRRPWVLRPEVMMTVAQWLTRQEITHVLLTCKQATAGMAWEYVWRLLVHQRAGITPEQIGELYNAALEGVDARRTLLNKSPRGGTFGPWERVLRTLWRSHPQHAFTCFRCRRSPITGPVFSCLYCFGPDMVFCSTCEATAHEWHPPQHVLIKWLKAYDKSKVTLHRGRFRYSNITWGVRESSYTRDYQVECSECKAKVEKVYAQCTTCAPAPTLCLSCAVGDRAALSSTLPGFRVEGALRAAEDALSMSFRCGAPGAASKHAGHDLLICPVVKFPRPSGSEHHKCACDVCDKKIPAKHRRYRCAKCYDYDRCEGCQLSSECHRVGGRVHPRKHPMMVLRAPEQRSLVAADADVQGMMHLFMPSVTEDDSDSADSDFSSGSDGSSDGSATAWFEHWNLLQMQAGAT